MNEIKIVIESLAELTAAVNNLAAKITGSVESQASLEPVMAPSYSNPLPQNQVSGTTPVMQMPVNQPAASAYPIQQPYQSPASALPVQQAPITPAPMTVPTTAVAQEYTYDQLAVAAAGLVNQGKQDRLLGILQGFGVSAMTEIPKERYGEFATAIKAEGAVI